MVQSFSLENYCLKGAVMVKNTRKNIGLRIKEIRKKRGLTQELLAEKVGVSGIVNSDLS